LKIGVFKSNFLIIPAGDRSKFSFTASMIFEISIFSVQKPSTNTETGCATQIAYDSCISHLSANQLATIFLAKYLAIYAALLSTFDGSLPEKAQPPCLQIPP
jgi:hypothetical protein